MIKNSCLNKIYLLHIFRNLPLRELFEITLPSIEKTRQKPRLLLRSNTVDVARKHGRITYVLKTEKVHRDTL